MIHVADTVNKYGVWKLKSAFQCSMEHDQPCEVCQKIIHSPIAKGNNAAVNISQPSRVMKNYSSTHAKRKFLRMPLANISVQVGPNQFTNFLIIKDTNYALMKSVLQRMHEKKSLETSLTKDCIKSLMKSCNSDPERERLRYAVSEASGLSKRGLRKQFGFEKSETRKERVEHALKRQEEIRESVYKLASIKEKAVLLSLGVEVSNSDTEDEEISESESEDESFSNTEKDPDDQNVKEVFLANDTSNEGFSTQNECQGTERNKDHDEHCYRDKYELPLSKEHTATGDISMNTHQLLELLKVCRLNWLAFVESLKAEIASLTEEAMDQLLLDFASQLPFLNLHPDEEKVIEQSRQLYLQQRRDETDEDDIVSDFDDEATDEATPEEWLAVDDPLSGKGKEIILRKLKCLKRQAQRAATKKIEAERFLKRRRSKRMGTILREFPNIGKDIESFVQSRGVGAEAWRRTGVLTFDGNRKVKQKVTFARIKDFLEEKYGREFSYGTVVQMCVARNRRRRSSMYYKGVAQVTCRRARKGFEIKYNPDCHWSNAFYKGLDLIQYGDGRDKLLLNRDDLSAFRMDTMFTSDKAPTHIIKGKPSLTTKTDYQASYPNTLQTTSYNFTASSNTGEICIGVVKSPALHPKCPGQHSADLNDLQLNEEINHVFVNSNTGKPKEIECVRVDSGGDEALYHEEIQFWWTLRHMQRPTRMQLVTSRYSGGSSLNRVELQNGCEVKARAGLFIPSTLNGTNFQEDCGKIDNLKLEQNLNDAIEVYISRVDRASCGDAKIKLIHGQKCPRNQELRKHFQTYTKGSEELKLKLKHDNPDDYELITNVLGVKRRHKNKDVPLRYVFQLACCYEQSCPHPLCKQGKPDYELCWYEGGPPISYMPLPVPDKEKPFGWINCPNCSLGKCAGHFLDPKEAYKLYKSGDAKYKPQREPPSEVIRGFYNSFHTDTDDSKIEKLAEKVLLTQAEVWASIQDVYCGLKTNSFMIDILLFFI
jgi:hypothetical protein